MDRGDWHGLYDTDPDLQARLRIAGEQIAFALHACPPGPIRVVSVCAGDGRDLIGALRGHPRGRDVVAFLIDRHAESVARGRAAARAAGLERQLEFVEGDAAQAAHYAGRVPADLVLVSGFLGHLHHEEVHGYLGDLRMFCRPGGWLIWNRHLELNDGRHQVPAIRERLSQTGFHETRFEATSPGGFACGLCRFSGPSLPLDASRELFRPFGLDRLDPVSTHGATPTGAPGASEIDVDRSIPAQLARVVAHRGDRTALGSGAWQPTYAELDRAGNRIAHRLLGRGVRGGDRVAVLMQHDTPQMAAVISILKARGIVVVMNPSDPCERLSQVLADAEPRLVLTDGAHLSLARSLAAEASGILQVDADLLAGTPHGPDVEVAPDDAAFLLYTSGSTGRPKGIVQTHRNILHNVRRLSRGMRLSPEDRILAPASLSGAHGVATAWCALLNAASLYPFAAAERGVTGLAEWIDDHRITVFVGSASLFRHFIRTLDDAVRLPTVRLVRLSSEPATAGDLAAFQRHFPAPARLLHTLSSSETGNITQAFFDHRSRVPAGRLPVGYAADGIEVLLLDGAGSEVEPGQVGEIVVRSRYLAPGYWGDPDLTAKRFSTRPGSGGLRLYRTGDLGRLGGDGQMLFLGRKDAQVKIRGYRIEPSEVEDALMRQPEVERAVVVAGAMAGSDEPRLVAFVVPCAGRSCLAAVLRGRLRASLPLHMVPAVFELLEELPLTSHGKVDRERLRRFPSSGPPQPKDDPPRTPTETALARLWGAEFQRDDIARSSDFFDLGGDSLGAAMVAARVHSSFEVELDLRAFLAHPRLSELAAEIDRLRAVARNSPQPPMVRVSRDGPLALSFSQERTWSFCRTPEESAGFTVACSHRIRGPLDVAVLRECIGHLARRHESLRTTFREEHGAPVQVVHPPGGIDLPLTDLSGMSDAEQQATALLREEARRPFDLAQGPLVRLRLARIRSDEHWLLRINHHIISDGQSWALYLRELSALYEARLNGEPAPVPDTKPLHYADYAAWQRRVLDPTGRAYRERVAWWADRCADAPAPIELPVRRRGGPRHASPEQGWIWWGLSPAIAARLDRLGRSIGATFYGVRLAGFASLLAASTRMDDFALGIYVTNRTQLETEDMFGFFANLALLRLRFDGRLTFRAWTRQVQEDIAETRARGEIPYERLTQELAARGVELPAVRTIFTVSEDPAPVRFGGLEMAWFDRQMEVMPWGFTLIFDRHHEASDCRVMYDARIYHPSRVRRFTDRLVQCLDVLSASPDEPMAAVMPRVAAASWRSRLLSWRPSATRTRQDRDSWRSRPTNEM